MDLWTLALMERCVPHPHTRLTPPLSLSLGLSVFLPSLSLLSLQACQTVLKLAGSTKDVKGYGELCRAIVVLMSCGVELSGQQEDTDGQVLVSG